MPIIIFILVNLKCTKSCYLWMLNTQLDETMMIFNLIPSMKDPFIHFCVALKVLEQFNYLNK